MYKKSLNTLHKAETTCKDSVLPCGLVLQVKEADCSTDKNMSQWSLNLQYNVDDDVDCMLFFHRQRI